jgi:uncharacterized iron-regulated membrane protein
MSDISHDIRSASAPNAFYRAAWRWHFYAGLFVVPFLMILAVTGMMMMFIGYIDGRDGEKITVSVPQNGQMISVSEQARQALKQHPNGVVVEWLKGRAANNVSVFRIKADGVQSMVAVDPYTGDVVESWERRKGWYDFADGIHSDLLLGTPGDRLLEIAAGLSIVLVVTGLYLWWPRDRTFVQSVVPNYESQGTRLLEGASFQCRDFCFCLFCWRS